MSADTTCLINRSKVRQILLSHGIESSTLAEIDALTIFNIGDPALSHPGVRERAGDAEELAGRWPLGCHSPNSCSRNGRCMYVGCKHDGADIRALASSFSSADRGGGK